MKLRHLFLIFSLWLIPFRVQALLTEIGLSYSYQQKTFNENNSYQTDSKTASISFYFLERFALETNYTDSFYESQEFDGYSKRTIQQSSTIIGADLVWMLADNKSMFQPYIKGGTGYITKKKTIKYENADAFDIPTKNGWAPGYGAGLKIKIGERFSVKLGYDVWRTPLDDGSASDDSSFKAGLTMYL